MAQQQMDPEGGPTAEHIRGVFERYAERFSAGDADAIAALYAEDAVVTDPVTAPPVIGREAIRSWYAQSLAAVPGMAMTLEGAVRVAGRAGAAALIVRFTNEGRPMMVETLDVMRFDDRGLIVGMEAYFGPSNYRAG